MLEWEEAEDQANGENFEQVGLVEVWARVVLKRRQVMAMIWILASEEILVDKWILAK